MTLYAIMIALGLSLWVGSILFIIYELKQRQQDEQERKALLQELEDVRRLKEFLDKWPNQGEPGE